MFGRAKLQHRNPQSDLLNPLHPLLTTLQAVHDQAKVEQQRSQHHSELMVAMSEQTKAINDLVASNREMVNVLAQLIVDTTDDEPAVAADASAGMANAMGGYVSKDKGA